MVIFNTRINQYGDDTQGYDTQDFDYFLNEGV
jgi:hypothetical protein